MKMAAPEKSDEAVISLASLPATTQQRRTVFIAGLVLFAVFAALVPFANTPLPEFNAFVPSVAAAMFISELITSLLLYAQYSIAPSRSFLVLASGYLFAALLVIPYSLTVPGAYTPTGLLGAGGQSAAWLFFASHFVFPGALFCYARLKDVDGASTLRSSTTQSAIGWSVTIVFIFACAVTWIATAENQYLPVLLTDPRHAIRIHAIVITITIIATASIALLELWFRRRTVLDHWLMLISVALIQEQIFISLSSGRFTLGFYTGRVLSLVTSIVVLVLLLQETTRLYARLARSNALLERERDNRLSNARAITASIAHEVSQPLTAIIANGGAALEYLRKIPPDHEEARLALNKIIKEGYRTGDVIDGVRALFERGDQRLEEIDFNAIILHVLESLRGELTDHGVATSPELADLPLVEGRRNQLQQVIFNLVHNALEAMQTMTNRKRALRVITERRGSTAVALVVEDSGPGINPTQLDNIFDAFVTTKSGGMGLGLAICRQIVESHGGQLLASSDGTSGAQFQVVLPIRSTDNSTA
jgi:signal transduction histidine kinase